MKRIIGVLAIAAALTVCLIGAGCAGSSGSSDNAITVSADGSAQVPADSASFTISIASRADDEAQARAAATAAREAIANLAKEAGLSDQDIVKADGDVVAAWGGYVEEQVMGGYWDDWGNWVETGPETVYYDMSDQIVGYDAHATVEVRGMAIDKVIGLVQQSRTLGATGFSNLHFVVADRESAYKQALAAAVDAAHAKAETLASASDVYVGRVVNMVENSDPDKVTLSVPGDASLLDAEKIDGLSSSMPTVDVQAAVTVSYAIS